MAEKRYTPSAPVTSVRVPCIEGLVIDTVTPGMTAPLVSVILPLIAPVVVLTVWPIAPAATPNSSATTSTGIRHCSRLMGFLRDPRETRDRNAAGKGIVTPTGHDTEIVTPTGHYTGTRIKAIGFIAILIASDASAGSWIGSQRNCRFLTRGFIAISQLHSELRRRVGSRRSPVRSRCASRTAATGAEDARGCCGRPGAMPAAARRD